MDRIEALSLESEVRYALTSHKHKEAVDLAFAALKEQEQGCEFCNADYAVMTGSRMLKTGDHVGRTAKFCPMCGRKLGGVE